MLQNCPILFSAEHNTIPVEVFDELPLRGKLSNEHAWPTRIYNLDSRRIDEFLYAHFPPLPPCYKELLSLEDLALSALEDKGDVRASLSGLFTFKRLDMVDVTRRSE